jgi:hypothetical protein
MSATIEIDAIEVLALKKLVLINHALSQALTDRGARIEQVALARVLNDITHRADLANETAKLKARTGSPA